MYVCICRGVTEKAIREAVHDGADRMRDLKECLGVTEQCGICACHAKQILDETLRERPPQMNNFLSASACLCESPA